MLIGLLIMILIGAIFTHLPSGYVPDEDQGNFMVSFNLSGSKPLVIVVFMLWCC